MSASAAQAYNRVNVHSNIDGASPHQLIQMLMGGVMSAVAAARGHMERGETEPKGVCISKAINRLEGLRGSLDPTASADIAGNLDSLYDYMIRQCLLANVDNSPEPLDEVSDLMAGLKSAWDAIEPQSPATAGPGSQPAPVAEPGDIPKFNTSV